MRFWTVCAVGSLAMISAAAAGQIDYSKMSIVPMWKIIKIPPVVVTPQPPPPPQAPQVQFRGCVYYEHADWQGKWRSIPGGTRRMAVGPSWNDIISSFSCNPACRVVAFTDDFKGQRQEFGTTRYVGDPWNDKISSMISVCQHPF